LLVFSIKYVCVKVCLWVWSIVNTDNIIYFVCQLRVLVLQGFWAFAVLFCAFSFRLVRVVDQAYISFTIFLVVDVFVDGSTWVFTEVM
jgi:hypothetical protein